jgi:diguanylate cyclase (GGDEF)-like protein
LNRGPGAARRDAFKETLKLRHSGLVGQALSFRYRTHPGEGLRAVADMSADSADNAGRPARSSNGRPAHQHVNRSRLVPPVADRDEQSLAASVQTASETDQTLSDTDQTAADADQTSAERDQFAADSDQAASDHDLASGTSRMAHEFSRDIRERSARERDRTAARRLQVAERRDEVAHLRDLAALARDQAADARDQAMAQFDAASVQRDDVRALTGVELIARAAAQRKHAAQLRAKAAEHRALAAVDREAAARDRELAARERQQAVADRHAFANELERAAVDALTGARTRAAGLGELDRELDRARRTTAPLVVGYVDVVGLKTINDTKGHGAGDALLRDVVAGLKARLRPYDLIIRLGGDEFLCAMSNLTLVAARERFIAVVSAISQPPDPGAIRVGFAQLRSGESAAELIARADAEMMRNAPIL